MAAHREAAPLTQERPRQGSAAKEDAVTLGAEPSALTSSPPNPSSTLDRPEDDLRPADTTPHCHRPDTSGSRKHPRPPPKALNTDTSRKARKHQDGLGPRTGDSTHTRVLSVDLEKQELARSCRSSTSHTPTTTMTDVLCEHGSESCIEDRRVLEANALSILVRFLH